MNSQLELSQQWGHEAPLLSFILQTPFSFSVQLFSPSNYSRLCLFPLFLIFSPFITFFLSFSLYLPVFLTIRAWIVFYVKLTPIRRIFAPSSPFAPLFQISVSKIKDKSVLWTSKNELKHSALFPSDIKREGRVRTVDGLNGVDTSSGTDHFHPTRITLFTWFTWFELSCFLLLLQSVQIIIQNKTACFLLLSSPSDVCMYD